METKVCKDCGVERSVTKFKPREGKNYRRNRCNDCPAPVSFFPSKRAYALDYRYKMTVDDYEAILDSQGGRCAICGDPPQGKALAVDHNHACCPGSSCCGECIRGLLCARCNKGLGFFRDNPEFLKSALRYLEDS